MSRIDCDVRTECTNSKSSIAEVKVLCLILQIETTETY